LAYSLLEEGYTMSRIGKAPINLPSSVTVDIEGQVVTVKGPLGTLTRAFRPEVEVVLQGQVILVNRTGDTRLHRSLHGLSRTLLFNMVEGVSNGFTKKLELVGVGYRAQVQGSKAVFSLGYSHPVEIEIPGTIDLQVEANTKVSIKGADKQQVGDLAAFIRSKRPPEPYKGKGIRYEGETIRRKAGKAGKK
jgi:large subunit ribosomal protein L6